MFLLRCIMATSWIGNVYFKQAQLIIMQAKQTLSKKKKGALSVKISQNYTVKMPGRKERVKGRSMGKILITDKQTPENSHCLQASLSFEHRRYIRTVRPQLALYQSRAVLHLVRIRFPVTTYVKVIPSQGTKPNELFLQNITMQSLILVITKEIGD